MAELRVTASQLRAKAEELSQLNATFRSKVDSLEETEVNLGTMWEGEAKDAFHNAFNSDKIQMTNFYNAIAQYVNVMQQIAQKYEQAESMNVQTASSRTYSGK